MDRNVDDKIRLIYQKDFEPGLAVRGDEDIIDLNEIIYLELDTTELSLTSTSINENNIKLDFAVYPNPANDKITLEFLSDNSNMINLSITNIIGAKINEFSVIPSNGVNRLNIDLNDMSNGIYFVNFNNNILKYTEKIIIAK
jgi:hypothetical protein